MAVSWGDTARISLALRLSFVTLRPISSPSPAVGVVRQDSILMVVDFPAPFTPSRANSSPAGTVSSSASTTLRPAYRLVRPTISMAFIFVPPPAPPGPGGGTHP